jgi:hypothetical protein
MYPSISMTVLTDGRKKYIERALPTWLEAYGDIVSHRTIIDDSGDADYQLWLTKAFPSFYVVPVGVDRMGQAAAMRETFRTVLDSDAEYNLHVEDDFILTKPFDLEAVVSVLRFYPELSQISFMRQPWYENEIEHGGVIEALEAQGTQGFQQKWTNGFPWVRHNAYWTCNPSIFPSKIANITWPDPPWSEMQFSKSIRQNRLASGIWGHRDDWVCTEHIGRERYGSGY